MGILRKQIGWSQESNLLWEILRQLNKLAGAIFNLKPKYKVYTALLTQSGGSNVVDVSSGTLTVGVTYTIDVYSNGDDFTNVGAPNNNNGTLFVATGTTPNNWSNGTNLQYNEGAPVVTVLENTIGNIWFEYYNEGVYTIKNADGWDRTKLWYGTSGIGDAAGINIYPGRVAMSIEGVDPDIYIVCNNNDYSDVINGQLIYTPIEIRVYN